jgi:hypothetical protein
VRAACNALHECSVAPDLGPGGRSQTSRPPLHLTPQLNPNVGSTVSPKCFRLWKSEFHPGVFSAAFCTPPSPNARIAPLTGSFSPPPMSTLMRRKRLPCCACGSAGSGPRGAPALLAMRCWPPFQANWLATHPSPRLCRPASRHRRQVAFRARLGDEDGAAVRLFTRRGHDWSDRYPAIAAAAATDAILYAFDLRPTPLWSARRIWRGCLSARRDIAVRRGVPGVARSAIPAT